ncbi:MAG: YeeE/YedE family protein [Paracoccaceae bacterium]
MLELASEPVLLALFGALGGLALGLAARLGRFCTLGAIEDTLYGGSDERLRMWGVAIGIGVIGTFGLHALGFLDISRTLYLSQTWNPLASILGGLLFGYGMALSGNCGFGALARLGGGDLRSFVIVLVMGLSSYVTLAGPLAALRVTLFPVDQAGPNAPGIAHGLSTLTGLSATALGLTLGLVILALSGGKLLRGGHGASLFWGAVVGLAVTSGWAGTYWLAENGFLPTAVRSHTFSAPIGETMLYAMTSSGSTLTFGIGSVAGVLAGAFIGSLIKGHFRWEACEDPRELRRQILGAVLMGIGAVTAVGCSVGQGISGFSVLAYSAPVTVAAIIAGAALGLRQLITGFASVS